MKRIIEQNPYENLKNIDFYFKVTDKERLKIDEAVINSSDLNMNKHQFKYRFILFKVEKIIKKKDKIFVNAYKANNNSLSIFMNLNNSNVKINIEKDSYAIVFGKITFSTKYNKYFIEITNDFQIKEIKENKVETWFQDVHLEKFNYEEIKNASSIDDNQVVVEKKTIETEIGETKDGDNLNAKNISNNYVNNSRTLYIADEQTSNHYEVKQIANKKNIEMYNNDKLEINKKNGILKRIINRFSKK